MMSADRLCCRTTNKKTLILHNTNSFWGKAKPYAGSFSFKVGIVFCSSIYVSAILVLLCSVSKTTVQMYSCVENF